ncbi:ZIP family metal transporter [Sporosarcina thermotolerans]|uniref:ZIP family metal transporter n=1 Tax=Sporosarcina thermotolerans TaxID=633404 RepID=A0AAW9AD31_9BACL|nr:ZIP family metal transporter [Sporosarcina thermotolerans]MDW0117531.1 ZIP family metal transporter [Sporosarcina thermotolerans]WHT49897.1 ZIP family metal transporter [Sporosarcina thermotolerans]
MIDYFIGLSPIKQAIIATLFTWGMTAIGAALVFTTKKVNQKFMDGMLGFAGGVMIAASFWSLLSPSIEMAENGPFPSWFPATAGFLLGGLFLWLADAIIPHLHPGSSMKDAEGINPAGRRRSTLLVFAITLHNIPEGLAVGVAFGAVAAGMPSATIAAAIALAVGIGIQNLPEGTAVSMPLRRDGMSRRKSFFYGQLSGAVEPFSAVIGVLAVTTMQPLLPFALSFAAGAMIFVVVEEVIPGSQENGNKDLASICLMIGFAVMMILDVAFG